MFYSEYILIVFETNNKMAEAFNPEQKLENIKMEVIQTFEVLYQYLVERRNYLLTRLDQIKDNYVKNLELERAIEQMRLTKDHMIATMTSNLIGDRLCAVNKNLDREIEMKTAEKVPIDNFEFTEFRCYSEKIRKAINEIDLYQLSPEYVGRENPVLTACYGGDKNGELYNARGIAFDRARNEVYVCDNGNSRIQVLSTIGEYVRKFGRDHLTEPHAICISQQDELFVTDRATPCVLKFSLTGKFLKRAGSRGMKLGQFIGIAGLCCEAGLVYICDMNIQQILIFDSELNLIKDFGYGELSFPIDIHILSDTIYILSRNNNCIYCYNRDCTLQKKIELFGQEQLMTTAWFFTIDKKGNFLITDSSLRQIRIFSSKGVLSNILSRGQQLQFLNGITIDNFDRVICVCGSKECFIKF